MIAEYNSGTKLVLQEAICQSDPEMDVNLKNKMKSKYETNFNCAPVNKTGIKNVFCGYSGYAIICYLNQQNRREKFE